MHPALWGASHSGSPVAREALSPLGMAAIGSRQSSFSRLPLIDRMATIGEPCVFPGFVSPGGFCAVHPCAPLPSSQRATCLCGLLLVCCLLSAICQASEEAGRELEARLSHRARVKLQFAHRDSEHPVRIVLPPEVQALARPDLGDLRLLATAPGQSPQEIPFRLAIPRDREDIEEHPVEWSPLASSARGPQWLVKTADPPPLANGLILQVDDSHRNNRHGVRVWGAESTEMDDWTLLTDQGLWLDLSHPGRRKTLSRISFPPAKYACYRVEMTCPNDGPTPPLRQIRLLHRSVVRAPHHEFPAPIQTTSRDSTTGELSITCAIPHVGLPLQAVHFQLLSAGDYLVTARISTSSSPERPGPVVGSGDLYQFSSTGISQVEPWVKCRGTTEAWLHVVLEADPETSLEVTEVTTIVSERGVLFDPDDLPTRPDEHLSLYFGNRLLESPAIQAAPLEDPTQWNSLPSLHLEPPVSNPAFRGEEQVRSNPVPQAATDSAEHFARQWGLLLMAVGLGLTVWGVRRLWCRKPE